MKKLKAITGAFFFIVSTAFVLSDYSWKISDGYKVRFSTEKAEGEFEKISGVVNFDEKNLAQSNFNVNIDVSSISTGNFLKNRHARGEDWFYIDKYPTINFTSDKITKVVNGCLVHGRLTMHGVTKQIEIPFTFYNNTFNGSFSVNRSDYKVGQVVGMSKSVGNKVVLTISVPVTK